MRTPLPPFRTGLRMVFALLSVLPAALAPAALAWSPAAPAKLTAASASGPDASCAVAIPRCPVLARVRTEDTGTTASTVSLTVSPGTLSPTQAETLTAKVAPMTVVAGSTYTLTGTVTFYDGATVLGIANVMHNTGVIAGISLNATVTHTITASYSGDATYAASVSSPVVLDATLLPVTVDLEESGTVLGPSGSVTLTATITPLTAPPVAGEQNPTGYVLFYAGSALIGGQVAVASGAGDTATASTLVSNLAAGTYSITATYSGDATFGAATSNAVSLQAEDFTLGCSANNVTVAQGGTASVGCNLASLGGLSGTVQVVCVEQNPPQRGALGCSFSPGEVTDSGATTLTVVTTGPTTTAAGMAGGGWWLAGVCAMLLPVCFRLRRRGLRYAAWCLLLVGLAGSGLGCSNSVNNSIQYATPLGVHTVKITAAEVVNTVTVSHYAYLTVNVVAGN